MSCLLYYLIIFLTPVMALLPRFFIRTLKNSLRPSDDVVVQLEIRTERNRGENLLASWSSRSTSKSSIFRWIYKIENFFHVSVLFVLSTHTSFLFTFNFVWHKEIFCLIHLSLFFNILNFDLWLGKCFIREFYLFTESITIRTKL